MTNIEQLAGEAYDAFEWRERPDGENFISCKDDAPEWVHDLVRAAHGGDFLPDDWRYDAIRAACATIHDDGESDDGHEFADGQVDAYTGERFKWLSSNLNRQGYVDDAAEQGLLADDADIAQRIGVGQYMEALEVYGLVLEALREHAEDLELAE